MVVGGMRSSMATSSPTLDPPPPSSLTPDLGCELVFLYLGCEPVIFFVGVRDLGVIPVLGFLLFFSFSSQLVVVVSIPTLFDRICRPPPSSHV
jgi:hypothetical protein